MLEIRTQTPEDADMVATLTEATKSPILGVLFNKLEEEDLTTFNEVAVWDGKIVGKAVAVKAEIDSKEAPAPVVYLMPLVVMPEYVRRGIALVLVRKILEECKTLGTGALLAHGNPEFFKHLDFLPAELFGIGDTTGEVTDKLMAKEITEGYLAEKGGNLKLPF
ncbi:MULTISPECIES: GNAT family N-acetyltransferase [Dehalococcoides]|jgi:putative acetyltransferase|uniref:Acetyltransferase, GNAT family n=2 Tax=Dehalococcoides mccartyi TaxID=61435 RepID=A0A1S7AV43_9CHLR|nr:MULTISPECIES: GNAT family N-acetyltransferase [Dehalococcoides]AGG06680.1 acetyltransferase, GNAT family [Dehalococcoides mccartyi DCMB5]AGG08173.1 acetyltransferase, GNAT family [Dehalococcoides mccartyi BTF08]AQU06215.1 GNAT family N-acetyltransferase [Dehalococcoides mccartyi]AQU07658.1 GNAT family N-acetyltransferase [Dehalococcoides mccartyi]AQW62688.1 GNAT family N-acetyltransferase [Dehalococcoides mccartyi]